MLVSGSQDCFIRIWRLSRREFKLCEEEKTANADFEIKQKESIFSTNHETPLNFAVSVESVLLGHENWVYSTKWFNLNNGKLSIISASMDKTLAIWQQGESDGIWTESARLGDVGGNTLGFYGCLPSPDGSTLMAYSFHGAFHRWNYDNSLGTWKQGITVGGHFEDVRDIAWEPKYGAFLLSVSSDQTTRLHAPWKRENKVLSLYP